MAAGYDLAFGLALGFSLVVSPGPMNALIASLSVRSWRAGFLTGLGAMTADLALALVVYLVHTSVDLAAFLRGIYVLGAIVMAYLAWRVWRGRHAAVDAPANPVLTFSQAVGLGLSNPAQILWWLTAGLAFAYLGGAVLFGGIFAAIAVWIVAFPLAVHLGSRTRPTAGRWVTVVSAGIMAGFAAYFVYLAL
ncbi:MAG TPA: LysE family transporter [Thermoplasmata archaeon]|jgi:threonine/homoserine/homoserine lactone efflux protein|nr:LysE family transporter [Thermoplasmata archaeon]